MNINAWMDRVIASHTFRLVFVMSGLLTAFSGMAVLGH